jgi:hypothetical protein
MSKLSTIKEMAVKMLTCYSEECTGHSSIDIMSMRQVWIANGNAEEANTVLLSSEEMLANFIKSAREGKNSTYYSEFLTTLLAWTRTKRVYHVGQGVFKKAARHMGTGVIDRSLFDDLPDWGFFFRMNNEIDLEDTRNKGLSTRKFRTTISGMYVAPLTHNASETKFGVVILISKMKKKNKTDEQCLPYVVTIKEGQCYKDVRTSFWEGSRIPEGKERTESLQELYVVQSIPLTLFLAEEYRNGHIKDDLIGKNPTYHPREVRLLKLSASDIEEDDVISNDDVNPYVKTAGEGLYYVDGPGNGYLPPPRPKKTVSQ